MADRSVGALPPAPDLYDDSLLVIEQQGAAMSLNGAQLKGFARKGVETYISDAQKAAQAAQEAVKSVGDSVEKAQAAETAAQTAREGAEAARKAVEDLEVSADTLPAGTPASVEKTAKDGHVLLKLGIPEGAQGPRGLPGSSIQKIERTAGTGAAGTVDTYTITLTDGSTTDFQVRNGADGKGAGDMLAAVYDSRGMARDVFAYADGLLPVIHPLTLAADAWEGGAAPYSQTVPVPGVLADETAQIIQPAPAAAGLEAWSAAGLRCAAQGDGTLTFTAREKPEADIPVNVAVQAARAREGGETV